MATDPSHYEYQTAYTVESTQTILAEVTPGSPLREVEVLWCANGTLLVEDEHGQKWSLTYPTSASVWVKQL